MTPSATTPAQSRPIQKHLLPFIFIEPSTPLLCLHRYAPWEISVSVTDNLAKVPCRGRLEVIFFVGKLISTTFRINKTKRHGANPLKPSAFPVAEKQTKTKVGGGRERLSKGAE